MVESIPRFCIVGKGLAGLTTAFLLQRALPHARLTVVEHAQARSGQIRSVVRGHGGILEQGFHSSILVNKNGRETLGLVKLLKLDEEVVSANIENSARRHLYHHGRLQLFPRVHHILQFCPPLLTEPLWPRGKLQDESVHAFVTRRSSRAVADRMADPICRGMLGGEARELSVRSCFPRLHFNERRFRSVFVGSMLSVFSAYQRRSWLSLDLLDPLLQRVSAGGRCYTLAQGLESLTRRLEERLKEPPMGTRPAEFLTTRMEGEEVGRLRFKVHSGNGGSAPLPTTASVEVQLPDGQGVHCETVICALPPEVLDSILLSSDLGVTGSAEGGASSLCSELVGPQPQAAVTFKSCAVVNVCFGDDVLKSHRHRGAGYFVGSLEDQRVIGMSWDSSLYPAPGSGRGGNRENTTRLTVYVAEEAAGSKAQAEEAALDAVRRHLGITEEPEEVQTTLWPQALPQYLVGHRAALQRFHQRRRENLPWLQVAGAGYFGTRSVADEVVDARELVDTLVRRFARFPGLVENEVDEDAAPRYGGGFDA